MSGRKKFLISLVAAWLLTMTALYGYRTYQQWQAVQDKTRTGWTKAPGGFQKIARRDVWFLPTGMTDGEIAWLDNDRLLFPAKPIVTVEGSERGEIGYRDESAGRGVYVWNVGADSLSRMDDLHLGWKIVFGYCDGVLHYATRESNDDKEWVLKMGPIGAVRDVPRDGRWREIIGRCKPKLIEQDRLRPEHNNTDHKILPLRKEHGYLYSGRCKNSGCSNIVEQDAVKPALFVRPGSDPPIVVPWLGKQTPENGIPPTYYSFADVYVVNPARHPSIAVGHVTGWPQGQTKPIWLLSPSGQSRAIELPWSRYLSGEPVLTKAGLVNIVGVISTSTHESGGFLYQDGKLVKLYDHVAIAYAVSPDGCRLAYVPNHHDKGKTPLFPSVIDFCKK